MNPIIILIICFIPLIVVVISEIYLRKSIKQIKSGLQELTSNLYDLKELGDQPIGTHFVRPNELATYTISNKGKKYVDVVSDRGVFHRIPSNTKARILKE